MTHLLALLTLILSLELQGNKALGTEKSGFLSKRSEGLRKVWQKRRCFVADGILTISHNKVSLLSPCLNQFWVDSKFIYLFSRKKANNLKQIK